MNTTFTSYFTANLIRVEKHFTLSDLEKERCDKSSLFLYHTTNYVKEKFESSQFLEKMGSEVSTTQFNSALVVKACEAYDSLNQSLKITIVTVCVLYASIITLGTGSVITQVLGLVCASSSAYSGWTYLKLQGANWELAKELYAHLPKICFEKRLSEIKSDYLILRNADTRELVINDTFEGKNRAELENIFKRFIENKGFADASILQIFTSNPVDIDSIFTKYPFGHESHEIVVDMLLENKLDATIEYLLDNIEQEWVQTILIDKVIKNYLQCKQFVSILLEREDHEKIQILKLLKNPTEVLERIHPQLAQNVPFNQWQTYVFMYSAHYDTDIFLKVLESGYQLENRDVQDAFQKMNTKTRVYILIDLFSRIENKWAENTLKIIRDAHRLELIFVYHDRHFFDDDFQWVKDIESDGDVIASCLHVSSDCYNDDNINIDVDSIINRYIEENSVTIPCARKKGVLEGVLNHVFEELNRERAEGDTTDYRCKITKQLSQFPVYLEEEGVRSYYDLKKLIQLYRRLSDSDAKSSFLKKFTYDVELGNKIREKAQRILNAGS